jgi:DNA-binding Xre family transcriptional regulator
VPLPSPLRAAVLFLAGQVYRWDITSVATQAHVKPYRARAFLGKLVNAEVLVTRQHPDGGNGYRKGWLFDAWRAALPKTHAGGNSVDYKSDKALRDILAEGHRAHRLLMADNIRRRRLAAKLSLRDVARAARIAASTLYRIETGVKVVRQATLDQITAALDKLDAPGPAPAKEG